MAASPANSIILRVRRDLTLGTLLKSVLGFAMIFCVVTGGQDNVRFIGLLAIGSLWFWMGLNSARNSRAAAQSPSLIASGQFDAAEKNIEQTVRSFSLFRPVKLQALHHLAVLRHAQRQWQESAVFAQALLAQRLGALQPISRPTRLLLADSLLEMNDLAGAHRALSGLHQEPLSLVESLSLLAVQLDYSARVGAWQSIFQNFMSKVQLAELMPASASARAQAFIALAARNVGRLDVATWLSERVELLTDIAKLTSERPLLRALWPGGAPAEHGL